MKKLFIPFLCGFLFFANGATADAFDNNIDFPVKGEAIKIVLAKNQSGIDKKKFVEILGQSQNITIKNVMSACLKSLPNYDARKPVSDCRVFITDVISVHNGLVEKDAGVAMKSIRPYGTKVYSEDGKYYMADCAGKYMQMFSGCVFEAQTNGMVCAFEGRSGDNAEVCSNKKIPEKVFVWVWKAQSDEYTVLDWAPGFYVVSSGGSMSREDADYIYHAANDVTKMFDGDIFISKLVATSGKYDCESLKHKKTIDIPNYRYANDDWFKSNATRYNDALQMLLKLAPEDRFIPECDIVSDDRLYINLMKTKPILDAAEKAVQQLSGKTITVYADDKNYSVASGYIKKWNINKGSLVAVNSQEQAYAISKYIIDDMIGNYSGVDDFSVDTYVKNPEFSCSGTCNKQQRQRTGVFNITGVVNSYDKVTCTNGDVTVNFEFLSICGMEPGPLPYHGAKG